MLLPVLSLYVSCRSLINNALQLEVENTDAVTMPDIQQNGMSFYGVPLPAQETLEQAANLSTVLATWPAYDWSPDGKMLMFQRVPGENDQLFLQASQSSPSIRITQNKDLISVVDGVFDFNNNLFIIFRTEKSYQLAIIKDGTHTLLTSPGDNVLGLRISPDRTQLAFSLLKEGAVARSIFVMSLTDGQYKAEFLTGNDGHWLAMGWSPDSKQLLVQKYLSASARDNYKCDVSAKTCQLIGKNDQFSTNWVMINKQTAYYLSNANNQDGIIDVFKYDFETRQSYPITDGAFDAIELRASPDGTKLAWASIEEGAYKLHLYDTQDHEEIPMPSDMPTGLVFPKAFSPDSNQLSLAVSTPSAPYHSYVLNLSSQSPILERWTTKATKEENLLLDVEPKLIHVTSFDGTVISAWVYMPPPPNQMLKKPNAMLYIHGGPNEMHYVQFSQFVQMALMAGNAVIAPNVRGSSGYGTAFEALDNGLLRANTIRDIEAVLASTASDFDKILLFGESYGGWLAFASAQALGSQFPIKCGVSYIGITDLVKFIEESPLPFQELRRAEYGNIEDPSTEQFLKNLSPINNPPSVPFLMIAGRLDTRIDYRQALEMQAVMQRTGTEAQVLIADTEGHVFQDSLSQAYRNAALTKWISTCFE